MDNITCPCCGYKTLSEIGTYEICPICFWEDDPSIRENPNLIGGNHVNLSEGQKNYEEIGACRYDMKDLTRKPFINELRSPDWKPI